MALQNEHQSAYTPGQYQAPPGTPGYGPGYWQWDGWGNSWRDDWVPADGAGGYKISGSGWDEGRSGAEGNWQGLGWGGVTSPAGQAPIPPGHDEAARPASPYSQPNASGHGNIDSMQVVNPQAQGVSPEMARLMQNAQTKAAAESDAKLKALLKKVLPQQQGAPYRAAPVPPAYGRPGGAGYIAGRGARG